MTHRNGHDLQFTVAEPVTVLLVEDTPDNATTPDRPVLGDKSALTQGAPAKPVTIDANTGKRR